MENEDNIDIEESVYVSPEDMEGYGEYLGLYTTDGHGYYHWFLIPKKRGKGYLKACFGGHHSNDASRKFSGSKADYCLGTFSICDIDGFLAMQFKKAWWEEGYGDDLKTVTDTLIEIFPRIKYFREIEKDDFLDISTKKIKK